ncbi:cadherin repeat domain-containing protein [Leeuwenhoekiella aequorea]|uniref:cadherin repeat domain-containing protein n=1 Tax=Leeuwenhoekiella aequorea TaxID=283736 RepID=UPI00352C98D7|tara:strand:- start:968 stop:2059 length:1092 start_codon:yes stop_codon:yes gene_type:complete
MRELFFVFGILGLISCDVEEVDVDKTEDPNFIEVADLFVILDENPQAETYLGLIRASQTDTTLLKYKIKNDSPQGALAIQERTGKLFVKDSSFFDFEIYTELYAEVEVYTDSLSATAKVVVELRDVAEAILNVENLNISINENPAVNQSLGSIKTTTNLDVLSYRILNQEPEGAIYIDEANGNLYVSDVSLFDFERNPVISAVIQVSSGDNFKNASVTINLNDVEEPVANYSILFRGFSDYIFCGIPPSSSYFYIETTSDTGYFRGAESFTKDGEEITFSFTEITGTIIKLELSIPEFNENDAIAARGTHMEGIFFSINKDGVELSTISAEELFICTDSRYKLILTYDTRDNTYDIKYFNYGF